MSEIDGSIILTLPGAKEGAIISSSEITVWDVRREAYIITALKMEIHFDYSRPEVVAYIEELVGRDGEPLRGEKVDGKWETINESRAWTQEYLDWHNGDHAKPWDGEIYNTKTFRYLVEDVENE